MTKYNKRKCVHAILIWNNMESLPEFGTRVIITLNVYYENRQVIEAEYQRGSIDLTAPGIFSAADGHAHPVDHVVSWALMPLPQKTFDR